MIVSIEENHGESESEDASDNISIVQIAQIFFFIHFEDIKVELMAD